MTAPPPSFDWADLFPVFGTFLVLGVFVGLLFQLMRRARAARWPGGKVGREPFFSFSNFFPIFRPTQAQLDAWREECARLTQENEELKSQVEKLRAERRQKSDFPT